MSYRRYDPPQFLLIGYDPTRDLPGDHLARLVEQVVEETVRPRPRGRQAGQPPYDPRLCVKVLVYSYCIGVRSSRIMERQCRESLPYLFLTRGDAPSYHTLCTARTQEGEYLEAVWEGLFTVAAAVGLERLGRIVVDSTKLRANASAEAVLKREEFAAVRAELTRILEEAAQVDAREAAEGAPGRTELGKTVAREQMREILRRVRRARRGAPPAVPASGGGESAPPGPGAGDTLPLEDLPAPAAVPPAAAPAASVGMSPQMLQRVAAGLQAIEAATADGRKHLCLTDPEARMMYGGRSRSTQECHSFEVAVDAGLLVAGQVTQEGPDNGRLPALLEAAAAHAPAGLHAVTADSGYYRGDLLGPLLEAGLDLCVPDPNTAHDLHRGAPVGTTRARSQGAVPFTFDAAAQVYRCPEGNVLAPVQRRKEAGQERTVYQAQASCQPCPRASECLREPTAAHRTLRVGDYQEVLLAALARFATPEYQERYRHRGEAVETVFGFLRGTLGYTRWLLRGAAKVACEGQLFKLAYQFRKVQRAWASA
jgi:transposase